MDIFTYMDKNGFAVVAIACFMCITLCVGFVQLGEALKVRSCSQKSMQN